MARTIRFHLDEHIDPAVADGVRRRLWIAAMGGSAMLFAEARMLGFSIEDLKAFAFILGGGVLCGAVCAAGWALLLLLRAAATFIARRVPLRVK